MDLFSSLRRTLPPKELRVFNALAASAPVRQALAAVDAEALARRQALVARLKAAPTTFGKAAAEAASRAAAATGKRMAADAARSAALTVELQAQAESLGASHRLTAEIGVVEKMLRESAAPGLDAAADLLVRDVLPDARGQFRAWTVVGPDRNRAAGVANNERAVSAAVTAAQHAREALLALQLQAMPADEVEAGMKAIFSKLNPLLQAIEVQGLELGADGEVRRTPVYGAADMEVV